MKKILVLTGTLCMVGAAQADEHVNGYSRSDGTYVQGYYRSSPNSSSDDNYSSRGNTNPYTGERGSKSDETDATAPQRTERQRSQYNNW